MTPLVGTSWKMNLTSSDAGRWFDAALPLIPNDDCDVFVLPPFPAIWVARQRLAGTAVAWGAQDVHPDEDGAHTGDVSAAMLADLGCRYVEVGHSERRRDHGETDDLVARKVRQIVDHDMTPILCVGELTRGPLDAAISHVSRQVEAGLRLLAHRAWPSVVIAYEPVWAIGVGAEAAEPAHVRAVHQEIHALVGSRSSMAEGRVIYGGSVDEAAAAAIVSEPGVDGLFVGRAALDPGRFAAIAGAVAGRP